MAAVRCHLPVTVAVTGDPADLDDAALAELGVAVEEAVLAQVQRARARWERDRDGVDPGDGA